MVVVVVVVVGGGRTQDTPGLFGSNWKGLEARGWEKTPFQGPGASVRLERGGRLSQAI